MTYRTPLEASQRDASNGRHHAPALARRHVAGAWARLLPLHSSYIYNGLLGSTLQACRAVTHGRTRNGLRLKKKTIAPAHESFPTPCQASSDSNAKAVSTCPTIALAGRDRG